MVERRFYRAAAPNPSPTGWAASVSSVLKEKGSVFYRPSTADPELSSRRAMSTEDLSRSSTESHRLLRSSSFEIDDLEAAGERHKYANGSANGQSRWKKSIKQSPPWKRPR
ncbi:MAG: hypothetical protein Q9225_002331, partial [Loekoesia sp. 1 TL-2023]